MFLVIDKVLNAEELQTFQKKLSTAEWVNGSRTAGPMARKVKKNGQIDEASPLGRELGQVIVQKLMQNPRFISAALPRKIFPPRFNRYREAEHYGAHVDNAVMQLPGGQGLLRGDISATLFLVDPAAYEGGELLIHDQYGAQRVKLAAGSMVLYPSGSLHQVTPVTKGERLAAFFWIQSMVRDPQDRALLFDLDNAVQQLSKDHAEHPTVAVINRIYHNLVRRWTDT